MKACPCTHIRYHSWQRIFYRRPYHFLRCDKIRKRAPAPISAIIRGSGFFYRRPYHFYAVIKYESVPLHPYPLSFVVADFLYKKRAEFFAPLFAFFHYFSFLESSCSSCSYCEKPSTDFISSSSTCSS